MRIVRILVYDGPEEVLLKHLSQCFVRVQWQDGSMEIREVACVKGEEFFLPKPEMTLQVMDEAAQMPPKEFKTLLDYNSERP